MIERAGRIRRGDQKEQAVKGKKLEMELKGGPLAARAAHAGNEPHQAGVELRDADNPCRPNGKCNLR